MYSTRFWSTWSDARETFGAGSPQSGAQFDNSAMLRQLETNVSRRHPVPGGRARRRARTQAPTRITAEYWDSLQAWINGSPSRSTDQPRQRRRPSRPRRRSAVGGGRRVERAAQCRRREDAAADRVEGTRRGHRHRRAIQRRSQCHRRKDPRYRRGIPSPQNPEVRRSIAPQIEKFRQSPPWGGRKLVIHNVSTPREIEMSGSLYVQTDGLRSFSQTHAGIAADLSQLTGGSGPAASVSRRRMDRSQRG